MTMKMTMTVIVMMIIMMMMIGMTMMTIPRQKRLDGLKNLGFFSLVSEERDSG